MPEEIEFRNEEGAVLNCVITRWWEKLGLTKEQVDKMTPEEIAIINPPPPPKTKTR